MIVLGVKWEFPFSDWSSFRELGVKRKNSSSSSTLPMLLTSSSSSVVDSLNETVISHLDSWLWLWHCDVSGTSDPPCWQESKASISFIRESWALNLSPVKQDDLKVSGLHTGMLPLAVVILFSKLVSGRLSNTCMYHIMCFVIYMQPFHCRR